MMLHGSACHCPQADAKMRSLAIPQALPDTSLHAGTCAGIAVTPNGRFQALWHSVRPASPVLKM